MATAQEELAGYLEERRVAAEREVERLQRDLQAVRNQLETAEAYYASVVDAITHHRKAEHSE